MMKADQAYPQPARLRLPPWPQRPRQVRSAWKRVIKLSLPNDFSIHKTAKRVLRRRPRAKAGAFTKLGLAGHQHDERQGAGVTARILEPPTNAVMWNAYSPKMRTSLVLRKGLLSRTGTFRSGSQLTGPSRVAAFPLVGFGTDAVSSSNDNTSATSSSPSSRSDARDGRR